MNKTTFNLGTRESSRMVRISQFIFGIICIATSVMWGLYIVKGAGGNESFWAPTIFLLLFGIYQIYAGLGKSSRYLTLEDKTVSVKGNSIGTVKKIDAADISGIVISSTGFTINTTDGGKTKVRFGMTHPESAHLISDTLAEYAHTRNIKLEITEPLQ